MQSYNAYRGHLLLGEGPCVIYGWSPYVVAAYSGTTWSFGIRRRRLSYFPGLDAKRVTVEVQMCLVVCVIVDLGFELW